MSVKLITYNESLVTPVHDAVIQDMSLSGNGIFFGCNITILNSNTLNITSGLGSIYGRQFEIEAEEIPVQLVSSGLQKGRLYLHIDLANISEPIQLLTQISTTLPSLIDNPDINELNNSTELELATFDVGSTEISNLVTTVQRIKRSINNTVASTTKDGLMSAVDKAKLDGVATGANKYTLPTANGSTLGGIKVGSNLSISNGVLSAKDATTSQAGYMSSSDKTKLNGVQASAKNIRISYSEYKTASLGPKADHTITVTKPSDVTGTVLACIPIGSGARNADKTTFLNLSAPIGSTLSNLKAGKFNGQTMGGTVSQVYTCAVVWVWY